MNSIAFYQYQLTRSSRLELLNYCKSISIENFLKSLSSFNNASIRQLLVHSANCYRFWLADNAMLTPMPSFRNESYPDLASIYILYEKVDLIMDNFLKHFKDTDQALDVNIARLNKTIHTTPLTIFTHVITHEFHHKGQILSMSRQLGYTPVDTDIIRF